MNTLITWKQNLKHLSKAEYLLLKEMCHLSKNVYNEALYNIRQHYFAESQYLRYEANYPLMKVSDNYSRLGANISQQTMRCVDAAFKSFFSLLDLVKKNKFSPSAVRIPKYLDKNGLYPLHLSQAQIKDGKFLVPMSPEMKRESDVRIRISIPPQILDKKIRQIHIIPRCNGRYFEVRYMFDEDEIEKPELDFGKVLAVDVGVNNFATCVTNNFDAFIIDGKYLKSTNQWYNKELSRLSSIKDHQKIKGYTKLQYRITEKRNRRIQDYIYCTAKYIVNYCIENKIGNIVFGYNDGFTQNPNLGRVNNQNFVMIPFGRLKNRLKFLCQRYGINFVQQEESYTSQASFFDNDEIPVWNPRNPIEKKFSGKRVKRGLYITSNGQQINADVNAALNILKKSNISEFADKQIPRNARGKVIIPSKIRFS